MRLYLYSTQKPIMLSQVSKALQDQNLCSLPPKLYLESWIISCADVIRVRGRIVLGIDSNIRLARARAPPVTDRNAVLIIKAMTQAGVEVWGVGQVADIAVGSALRACVLGEGHEAVARV